MKKHFEKIKKKKNKLFKNKEVIQKNESSDDNRDTEK